jgi:hypothetical protein
MVVVDHYVVGDYAANGAGTTLGGQQFGDLSFGHTVLLRLAPSGRGFPTVTILSPMTHPDRHAFATAATRADAYPDGATLRTDRRSRVAIDAREAVSYLVHVDSLPVGHAPGQRQLVRGSFVPE